MKHFFLLVLGLPLCAPVRSIGEGYIKHPFFTTRQTSIISRMLSARADSEVVVRGKVDLTVLGSVPSGEILGHWVNTVRGGQATRTQFWRLPASSVMRLFFHL